MHKVVQNGYWAPVRRAAAIVLSAALVAGGALAPAAAFADTVSDLAAARAQLESIGQRVTELDAQQAELESTRSQQEQNVSSLQASVDELNSQRAAASDLVSSLDAQVQAELAAEAEQNATLQAAVEASQAGTVSGGTDDAQASQAADEAVSGSSSSGSSGSSSSTPDYDASTGNAVVARAYSKLGSAYVWGAYGPNAFDCSGFVSYCLTGSYTRLGTTYTFMNWPQVSDPQPGDVCTSSTHCGIYIGNGQMIHASRPGVGVVIGSVQSNMIFVRMP